MTFENLLHQPYGSTVLLMFFHGFLGLGFLNFYFTTLQTSVAQPPFGAILPRPETETQGGWLCYLEEFLTVFGPLLETNVWALLLGTSASLLVTSALLVVTRSY